MGAVVVCRWSVAHSRESYTDARNGINRYRRIRNYRLGNKQLTVRIQGMQGARRAEAGGGGGRAGGVRISPL